MKPASLIPAEARRSYAVLAAAALVALVVATAPVSGQGTKRALTIDDYSQWRSMSNSRMSGDGNWVSYEVRFTNTAEPRPALRLVRLDTDQEEEIPDGGGAVFSDDSRWVAYTVAPGGGAPRSRSGGGGGAGADTRRVELRGLSTGAVLRTWNDVQSFSFSPGSAHLELRRRPDAPNAAHSGVDVILHDLRSGRDRLLGSVNELAFNHDGSLVAFTVDAAVRDGNGLFVMELASGRLMPLDNDTRLYSGLVWNEGGRALAVLKGVEVPGKRERENVLLVIPDVQAAMGGAAAADETSAEPIVLDPAIAAGFPADWVASERRDLTWSSDDRFVLLGIKPQVPAPDTAGRNRGTDEVANVDVWNTLDERIQSHQMAQAEADRNFTFRAGFDVVEERFIPLADSTMRELDLARGGRWGVGRDRHSYIHDFERPVADFYRVDLATGERKRFLENQLTGGGHVFGISPDGRYFLYWRDSHFQAYDLDAERVTNLTATAPVSFENAEYDYPGPRPAYGVVGYSEDGRFVMVNHRYDLWLLSLTGADPPRNLTGGMGEKREIRFNFVPLSDPARPPGRGRGGGAGPRIDLSRPITLSAYGQWTKKSGYFELSPEGEMEELIFKDALVGGLTKAADVDRFMFTRQTFQEFPDLHIAGRSLADTRKLTDLNPQQSEFLWGHRILFDFENRDGVRLQGILAIPEDHRPGERRPMLVNFYEKSSQNLHRYPAPSYMGSIGSVPVEAVSKGYLVMHPDIHFRTRTSHSDMLECIEAAVQKVIDMGYADPERIGLNGHSYAGQGAAFVGTRSRMFAAVGMGASVSDLTSDFSHNWGWSYHIEGGSGRNAAEYYLYTQGRQGTNPWDDPELYRFESGRTHVRDAVAPFLIVHGTADPTVSFQEGLGMYNALRFHNKPAVLLAYPGEGHSLRGLANRRDLTLRYMQFFDHFLRDAPAPKWWSEGVPFLEKDGTRDPTGSGDT